MYVIYVSFINMYASVFSFKTIGRERKKMNGCVFPGNFPSFETRLLSFETNKQFLLRT